MNVKRRSVGKEDVAFDTSGTGEVFEITNSAGEKFTLRKINASHIPLTIEARLQFSDIGVDIDDVNSAIMQIVHNNNNLKFATLSELKAGKPNIPVAPAQLLQLEANSTADGLGFVRIATDEEIKNRDGSGVVTAQQAGLFNTVLPIGFGPIPWYFGSVPDASWAFANGTKLPKALYEEFYDFLQSQGAIISTSASGYDSRVHFGYSAGNIIMPNLVNLFPRAASETSKAGLFGEETLPNITGSFDGAMWKHSGTCSGAFSMTGTGGGAGDSGNVSGKTIAFNASNSSSVYGDGNVVAPKNFTVNWIFKVKA